MHIIFLTSNISPHDGTGTYSRGIIQAARRAGFTPVVLLPEHYKGGVDLGNDITVQRVLPSKKAMADSHLKAWFCARRIRKFAETENASLVHCLFERYAPLARSLAKCMNVPYLVSAVGSYALEGFERRTRLAGLYRRAFEGAFSVPAISQFTAKQLKRHAPKAKVEVIYPGIDKSAIDDGVAWGQRTPMILSVGALKPRKGQDMILKAFAQLAPDFPQWRYVIAGACGDQDMLDQVKSLVNSCQLEGRVEVRGHVSPDDLMALYRRAGIFALAPRADGWKIEGFGLVFLEAAAHGIPSVCTRECGFAEYLESERIGSLAADDTPEALRAALEPLIRDDDLRREMGESAKAFSSRHTWDAAFEPLGGIYKRACQRD